MRVSAFLDYLAGRTHGQPTTGVVCTVCQREPAITGDGAQVGWACIFQLGAAVDHPERLDEDELRLLLDEHGDVVELRTYPALAWEHTGGELDARIRERLDAIAQASTPTAAAERHAGHDIDVAGCSYCAERSYWRRARS